MTLIDKIAYRFGYLKAPKETLDNFAQCNQQTLGSNAPVQVPSLQTPTAPEYFGLSKLVKFDVIRDGQLASKPATWQEMLDFIDACGVDLHSIDGELFLVQVIAGIPFQIDESNMVFRVRAD